MVIVQHSVGSVKEYIEATRIRGHVFAVPERCPYPGCEAVDSLIYWGTYERWACTEDDN